MITAVRGFKLAAALSAVAVMSAAVILTLGFTGCGGDDGDGGGNNNNNNNGGGNTDPKTLVVAMPAAFYEGLSDVQAVIVPEGTTTAQINPNVIVAVGETKSIANPVSVPLYVVDLDGDISEFRWKGSGKYDVFVSLGLSGPDRGFTVKAVSFSSATTTIQLSNANEIGGGGGGGSTCTADFGEITIGSQTWAKRNLDCDYGNSKCYGNDPANCETYGRLYDWETAKTACPSGWHLPSDDEWGVLVNHAGGMETAGGKLKATSGWNENGNGTDDFGFSALPGGHGFSDGRFNNDGETGNWWSATEGVPVGDISTAYLRYMHYAISFVDRLGTGNKTNLYSVRCVKN